MSRESEESLLGVVWDRDAIPYNQSRALPLGSGAGALTLTRGTRYPLTHLLTHLHLTRSGGGIHAFTTHLVPAGHGARPAGRPHSGVALAGVALGAGAHQDRRDQFLQRHRGALHRALQAGRRDGRRGDQCPGRRPRSEARGDLPRRQGPARRGRQAGPGPGRVGEGRAHRGHLPVERRPRRLRLGQAEQGHVRGGRAAHRGADLVEGA